jgi:transposase-like protein
MGTKEKGYPAEFKMWVLQQALEREGSMQELCGRLGIGRHQVYRWQRKFLDEGFAGLEKPRGNPKRRRGLARRPPGPGEEIALLHKKIGELQMQVDFLTQACRQTGAPRQNSNGSGASASIAKSAQ